MKKWIKWLPVVAVLSLVVVIGSMVGCAPSKAPTAPAPPVPAPQPAPSAPPTAAPPTAKGTPDLALKDVWQEQSQIYYKIANLGTAASQGGTSRLYVEGQEKAHDYVEPVPAGQEITVVFHGWSFTVGGELIEQAKPSVRVRVCLDTENATTESNEANNCLEKVMGMPFVYDFTLYATSAEWMRGNDQLRWPMAPTDDKGAAFPSNYKLEDGQFYSGALAMYPPHQSNASIQGTFGEPYSKTPGSSSSLREVTIPELAKFTAKVGFRDGAKTDGVTVSFGYVEPNRNLVWLKTMKVSYDGNLDNFTVDLSSLAGQKVLFILKVEAGNSWEDDWLTWVEPRITQ